MKNKSSQNNPISIAFTENALEVNNQKEQIASLQDELTKRERELFEVVF